jgi:hypothetical protein
MPPHGFDEDIYLMIEIHMKSLNYVLLKPCYFERAKKMMKPRVRNIMYIDSLLTDSRLVDTAQLVIPDSTYSADS